MSNAGAERKAQMTEKGKLTLRKPLVSKGENAECKAAYEGLLTDEELAEHEAANGDEARP